MRIIGIDPGKTGGLVCLDEGAIVDMIVMPDHGRVILDWLEEMRSGTMHVFLEKAQAMPKNGAVSMFNYGVGYGIIQGVLIDMECGYTLVPPRTWTKVMHAGASGTDPKKKSLDIARRLFPGQDLRNPESKLAKKPHEGIIDALLIAEYGRRTLGK